MHHPDEVYPFLDDEKSLPLMLRELRQENRLTQRDIAEHLGTTASAIARLETCGGKKCHSPVLRTLYRYAWVLRYRIKFTLEKYDPNPIEEE